jgi:imidazolonepropionase-like amidohydrolase
MFGECHAHVILDSLNYRASVGQHQNKVNEKIIRDCFTQYKNSGIHFFRDGGDNLGVSKRAKEIAQEYEIDYRTPIFALHKKGNYGGIVGQSFTDIKEFYEKVSELKKQRTDFIKIMASGILDFNEFGKITQGTLNFEELKEIMHIAHSEGFSVMAHINGAETIKKALAAGVDSIEHGYYMDDETIGLLSESKTVWVPTMTTAANLLKDKHKRYPFESVAKIAKLQKENVKKAIGKGAHVALGSDAGAYLVPHCSGLTDEYNYFKEIIQDEILLHKILTDGENLIKEKFRRNYG